MMPQWEYCQLVIFRDPEGKPRAYSCLEPGAGSPKRNLQQVSQHLGDKLWELLNQYGREGWELVMRVDTPGFLYPNALAAFYFKRPVEEDQSPSGQA